MAARLAEVRRLFADEALLTTTGVVAGRGDLATAYRAWSTTYDEPRNSLFDSDEPVMHGILGGLPAGSGKALRPVPDRSRARRQASPHTATHGVRDGRRPSEPRLPAPLAEVQSPAR